MFHRFTLATALLLFLAVSASSQNLASSGDAQLRKAAQRLKAKDYRGAWDKARAAADAPEKSMIAGVAAYRLDDWVEAAGLLGKAAKELPLIADYPLFWQANALFRTARYDEALEVTKRLLRDWPESPLVRPARMLQADVLFARREYRESHAAYIGFVESYPTGSDSITALYQAAQCRQEMGEEAKAVQELRGLWLTYPASPVAEKAEENLRELARRGFAAEPYSADELFRRGSTLYSLNKFDQAIRTFDAIPHKDQPADFQARVTLKTGQALHKARRFRDAERTFAGLLNRDLKPALQDEARFWHAKALERTGRDDDAFAAYLKIAEAKPAGEQADDALLEAAFIRKFQGRYQDQLGLLTRLQATTTDPKIRQRAAWEAAWASYATKEYRGAAESFRSLQTAPDYRERALYWHGRALEAAGEREVAAKSFALVLEEFPLSFYANQVRKDKVVNDQTPALAADPVASLPLPAGYDRVKLLIALGLHDEARKELAAGKKKGNIKGKSLLAMARLHLEMDDYASASALFRGEPPRRIDTDSLTQWGIIYPRGFRDSVSELAAEQRVSEELVYALIKAESSFNPTAVSPVGAIGLMQLMPATAKAVANGNGKNGVTQRLTEPEFNIKLGIRHLKDLLKQYKGNVVSAVAAYNAGSTPVDRWRKNLPFTKEDEFIENIPYHETREYVKKVLAGADMYRRLYRPKNGSTAVTPPIAAEEYAEPAASSPSGEGGNGMPQPAQPSPQTTLPAPTSAPSP
ncbi:MAG: outer membrane protein assembly factor BamD [Desulfuromonadales bacterium]|nr:MAG: outer membrane protein assembly factor BamD [Desulfuromonadales bacterium]